MSLYRRRRRVPDTGDPYYDAITLARDRQAFLTRAEGRFILELYNRGPGAELTEAERKRLMDIMPKVHRIRRKRT